MLKKPQSQYALEVSVPSRGSRYLNEMVNQGIRYIKTFPSPLGD